MKLFLSALVFVFAQAAGATVDAWTDVHLVTSHTQVDNDYEVRKFPFIGCFGPAWGPKLEALTAEYKAPMSLGCGGAVAYENINALSCGKVLEHRENADYTGLSYLRLSIANCPNKSTEFITAIKEAVHLNFGLVPRGSMSAEAKGLEFAVKK